MKHPLDLVPLLLAPLASPLAALHAKDEVANGKSTGDVRTALLVGAQCLFLYVCPMSAST